ncbi:hypothetical protein So717_38530 [Roseobacter cerasinus]|uniref:Methyltransferase n=1 Tax=Roseobacter cerasinus TaxID=2602289 RepID=A0A640VXL3_9RHOB|nr:hypothetical protein So717_38530 [Roseobacter cerasinus]
MTAAITSSLVQKLAAAARDTRAVSGASHKFYRYPARFSPQFAIAAIEAFTKPGDLVLDPFIGGGTTGVEAMMSGRQSIGTDINELALFVSKVKTTILTSKELEFLRDWFPDFSKALRIGKISSTYDDWREKGYFRHLETQETWRHRNLIQSALELIETLPNDRLSDFMRCVVLRSMQLSLDGRKEVMSIEQVRKKIDALFDEMLTSMAALPVSTEGVFAPILKKCNAAELHNLSEFDSLGAPKLVLTSPPYPGVHVLYHRWQVKGRRETAAPYWIANKLDGDGERYYTLGNRHERDLKTYFQNLEAIFASLREVVDQNTVVVQMVAFSKPEWQLPQYLEVMENAGFCEHDLEAMSGDRIWRDVPNRKWHAARQVNRAGSREVVLIHRRA